MKKWRIVQPHPEDRFEPDDEVADKMRADIRNVQSKIYVRGLERGAPSLNDLYHELGRLRVALAERLYGK